MTTNVIRERALKGISMEFMAIKMSLVVVQRRFFNGFKRYWRPLRVKRD
jgi:hypothetical protein